MHDCFECFTGISLKSVTLMDISKGMIMIMVSRLLNRKKGTQSKNEEPVIEGLPGPNTLLSNR